MKKTENVFLSQSFARDKWTNMTDFIKMKFTIETLNDNGSGMEYKTKEEFMKEIGLMIDDCIANGGTFFDIQVDSDASCFYWGE